jgi:peroxiredoxin
MATDYDRFKAAGAQILAISVDPPEKSSELSTQLKLPFPLLSDRDHKVIDEYAVLDPSGKYSIASVFIVDKSGIVRWSYITDDYKVRPLDDTILAELAKLR